MLEMHPTIYEPMTRLDRYLRAVSRDRVHLPAFRRQRPHSKDSLDIAGEIFRSGLGLTIMYALGTITSFFLMAWTAVKTVFFTLRVCLLGKKAEVGSISDLSNDLRNLANAIDENFGETRSSSERS